jgi:hypothetical protein
LLLLLLLPLLLLLLLMLLLEDRDLWADTVAILHLHHLQRGARQRRGAPRCSSAEGRGRRGAMRAKRAAEPASEHGVFLGRRLGVCERFGPPPRSGARERQGRRGSVVFAACAAVDLPSRHSLWRRPRPPVVTGSLKKAL